jgi:hypothetical protein
VTSPYLQNPSGSFGPFFGAYPDITTAKEKNKNITIRNIIRLLSEIMISVSGLMIGFFLFRL